MTRSFRGELWKPIPCSPHYHVSNMGRVRRELITGGYKACNTFALPDGTLKVQINSNGYCEGYRVARLVGAAFSPDFQPDRCPIYKNGKRSNCKASNLTWVPRSEVTGHPYSRNSRPEALRAKKKALSTLTALIKKS